MTGPQPTEDKLIKDLILTNRRTDGDTITRKQYEKHGDYNPWQAVNRFGSWREARATAGVFREESGRNKTPKHEILKDMAEVNKQVDGHLNIEDYREHGQFSVSLIYTRFDSFTDARNKAYNI